MYKVFFKILIKSLTAIKNEPIILIPFLAYRLIIISLINLLKHNNVNILYESYVSLILIEWIIPIVLIQPLTLLMAKQVFFDKELNLKYMFNHWYALIYGFFIVSLFYKPFYVYGIKKISELSFDQPYSLDINVVFIILLSIMINFVLIFFQSTHIFSKDKLNIMSHVLLSVGVLKQFKWVSLGVIAYFILIIVFFSQFFVSFLIALMPNHFHFLAIGMIDAIQSTLFYVFIFRLYLYLVPLSKQVTPS